jgi:plastocyanin
MRSPFVLSILAVVVLAGCGGDDGAPTDAPVAPFDAPIDSAAIDAAATDAATDARVIDAMPDAPGPPTINDCTEQAALDRTAAGADRSVSFPGFAYTPKCMKVRVGQTVTWTGDFGFHPLRGGLVVNGVRTPQAGNPIPATSSGASVAVTFNTAGGWGYYCNVHFAGGMRGAIFVVP